MNQKERVPKGDPAFGIRKSRKFDGVAYQEKLRTEWDSHLLTKIPQIPGT